MCANIEIVFALHAVYFTQINSRSKRILPLCVQLLVAKDRTFVCHSYVTFTRDILIFAAFERGLSVTQFYLTTIKILRCAKAQADFFFKVTDKLIIQCLNVYIRTRIQEFHSKRLIHVRTANQTKCVSMLLSGFPL